MQRAGKLFDPTRRAHRWPERPYLWTQARAARDWSNQ